MAAKFGQVGQRRSGPASDRLERLLAVGAAIILAALLAAAARGWRDWARVEPALWAHLATIAVALALTPAILLGRGGSKTHRQLGWIWSGALFGTAAISFAMRGINHGGLSPIHALSGFTLLAVPALVWTARTHRVMLHRSIVRYSVLGALVVAGAFTFIPDRTLGDWLFG